jgi:hypothetical protein
MVWLAAGKETMAGKRKLTGIKPPARSSDE